MPCMLFARRNAASVNDDHSLVVYPLHAFRRPTSFEYVIPPCAIQKCSSSEAGPQPVLIYQYSSTLAQSLV